jgi:CSLREA domain-containing protein
MPAVATAESFEVNSVADEGDANPGDEFCKTATDVCTLRAALEESNALGGADFVDFKEEGMFDGGMGGTIALTERLPTITGEIEIFGECVPLGEELRPCVGIDGPGLTEPAFSVENAEGVAIGGLAITGAQTGIEASGTTRFKSLGNWLGVRLDRSAKGNGTGILLGPGAHRSLIGNGGTPNVFANNSGVGLDVFGATATEVLGDYFGVAPDGDSAAGNGKDIEVTGVESGPAATGTKIGVALSAQAQATPACDGGCNVISGAGTHGVDLEGDGGPEAPATETAIVGNYVGLGADGAAVVPNGLDGIHVGSSSHAVVGGPRGGEANLIAGGVVAVRATPGAGGLVVRGNSIGLDAAGAGIVAPSLGGIVVSAEAGASAGAEATIGGNEIAMQGGVGIEQRGFGAWIAGNRIAGAQTGIVTSLSVEEHGNLIEGNLIEASEINAVLLENEENEVLGNEIVASGAAGVRVHGLPPFGVSGNRIGGDLPWQENAISGAGGAAIEIADAESSENEIGRNRGAGNGRPFIDLVSLDPTTEPKGPNAGLKPPLFSAVTTTGASGRAAPDALVRVFRKAGAAPGEVASFIGETVADENGFWALTYPPASPPASYVAATQTLESRRTSELAIAATPAAVAVGGAGGGGSSGGGGGSSSGGGKKAPDTTPPQTKILRGPSGKIAQTTAKFKFSADEAGVTFRCKLDRGAYQVCKSPKKYKRLEPGRHVFKVRAVDRAGNIDPTAAKRKFTVVG